MDQARLTYLWHERQPVLLPTRVEMELVQAFRQLSCSDQLTLCRLANSLLQVQGPLPPRTDQPAVTPRFLPRPH